MRKDQLVTEIMPLARARESTTPGRLVPIAEDFEGAMSDLIEQAIGNGATTGDVAPSWASVPLRCESTIEEISGIVEEPELFDNHRRRMLLLMLLLTSLIWWTGDLLQIMQTAYASAQVMMF